MKIIQTVLTLSVIAWHAFAVAELTASPLVVVEDLGGPSTLPYYEALAPQNDALPTPSTPAIPSPFSEAAMLPVRSPRLTPGHVTPRSIQATGLTPLFLLGDDTVSRAWISQRLGSLQQLGAVGLVVNVETSEALQALRALAPGLELLPVSAEDLTQRLKLNHYPVLITATRIEQ